MPKKFLTGLDLSNQKIANVADGTNPTDAVNLQQVQAAVRGLSWKQSVRAGSTANVTLASPGATIDGVTLVSGDRILLKNQTAGAENGIYVWTGAATPLTRATDADSSSELLGATAYIESGTVNADKMYTQTTDAPITIGTTTMTWAMFGGGVTYSNGNGLDLTGTVFSVRADTGILVTASGVKVDPSYITRKYAADCPATTTWAVAHNLNTTDITYNLRVKATGEMVETDAVVTDANTLTFTFASAPAAAQYRVAVHA